MPEWQTQTDSICTEFSCSNKLEITGSYLWRAAGKGTDGAWDPILSYFLIWMQLPGMCLVDFSKYLVLGLPEPNGLWSGRCGLIKTEDCLLSAPVARHVLLHLWLQFPQGSWADEIHTWGNLPRVPFLFQGEMDLKLKSLDLFWGLLMFLFLHNASLHWDNWSPRPPSAPGLRESYICLGAVQAWNLSRSSRRYLYLHSLISNYL